VAQLCGAPANELKYLSFDKYERWHQIDEIGRMIGSWINKLRAARGKEGSKGLALMRACRSVAAIGRMAGRWVFHAEPETTPARTRKHEHRLPAALEDRQKAVSLRASRQHTFKRTHSRASRILNRQAVFQ